MASGCCLRYLHGKRKKEGIGFGITNDAPFSREFCITSIVLDILLNHEVSRTRSRKGREHDHWKVSSRLPRNLYPLNALCGMKLKLSDSVHFIHSLDDFLTFFYRTANHPFPLLRFFKHTSEEAFFWCRYHTTCESLFLLLPFFLYLYLHYLHTDDDDDDDSVSFQPFFSPLFYTPVFLL